MSPMSEQSKEEALATFGRKRLEPGAYRLDLSRIASLPLELNGTPSTFIEILRNLTEAKIDTMPGIVLHYAEFDTAEGKIVVSAKGDESKDWGIVRMLVRLVELAASGINIDHAVWFYYQHDYSRDAAESHSFFIVDKNTIVSEHTSFFNDDPLVLLRREEHEPIWHSHVYFDEAWQHYWYRKFYMDTLQGQLMVLRPDRPPLYHYSSPATPDPRREVRSKLLTFFYRLGVIAFLAAIASGQPRSVSETIVIALVLVVILILWDTRKVERL
jgi:hypothetical protein